jgi:hypothetical protein
VVNDLPVSMALAACSMQTTVPASTMYSRVQARREKGTYDALRRTRLEEAMQVGLIIDITKADDDTNRNVSPVTLNTTDLSSSSVSSQSASVLLSSASQSSASSRKKSRRSPKQASIARLDAKRLKVEYEDRFKAAFKDATNLVASGNTREPAQSICSRLNKEFNLDGKRKLKRSTVYQAAKDGLAGTSPKKKGPPPKIPLKLVTYRQGLGRHSPLGVA